MKRWIEGGLIVGLVAVVGIAVWSHWVKVYEPEYPSLPEVRLPAVDGQRPAEVFRCAGKFERKLAASEFELVVLDRFENVLRRHGTDLETWTALASYMQGGDRRAWVWCWEREHDGPCRIGTESWR